jgi:hypothetical protein
VIINQTKRTKPEEDKLRISLELLLEWHRIDNLKHLYYDFHEETNGDRFYKVNEFVNKINDITEQQSYFIRDQFGTRKIH